jgi:hypothetical protein
MFDNLIGFPVYDVVRAAVKNQLNVFISREWVGRRVVKHAKPDEISNPVLLLEVEDGKVTNLWLVQ